jgi:hypothetical protein
VTGSAAAGRLVQSVALLVATVIFALIGAFAASDPLGFYHRVPGVWRMGPYDQHLVVDVGFLFLALSVTLLAALFHREKVLVRTATVAALVFAVPHHWYHVTHLRGFSTSLALNELVSPAIMAAAPLVALAYTFIPTGDSTSRTDSSREASATRPSTPPP